MSSWTWSGRGRRGGVGAALPPPPPPLAAAVYGGSAQEVADVWSAVNLQAFEDTTGKTSSSNKEAFRAAMVHGVPQRRRGVQGWVYAASQACISRRNRLEQTLLRAGCGRRAARCACRSPAPVRAAAASDPCLFRLPSPPLVSPPPRLPARQLNALERRLFFIPSFKIYGKQGRRTQGPEARLLRRQLPPSPSYLSATSAGVWHLVRQPLP